MKKHNLLNESFGKLTVIYVHTFAITKRFIYTQCVFLFNTLIINTLTTKEGKEMYASPSVQNKQHVQNRGRLFDIEFGYR